ncbi:MAG TPA: GNAT family N-acetyltransferase, partial [Acidimicrobiales bacterium]|nr:GNAT family N-acetyltransferase [Acidimicrobiales bacterium]
GGRFVANCGFHTLDVTLPAGPGAICPVIPMGGVTRVGVHPTHRRQGLLRRMMEEMLADSRARGEAVAGLHASESVIYGRFGFGLATEIAEYAIDTREAAFLGEVPRLALQLLDREEAGKVLPDLFDRFRRLRAGEPNRIPTTWESIVADEPSERHGGNPAFFAACDDGYVIYRSVNDGPSNWRRDRILVEELRGANPEVESALWQFVFELDLIDRVTAIRRPVDEPLKWRLADPRQLRVEMMDDRLHVRIVDMAAAFTARGYTSEARLVLDVLPPPVDGGPEDSVPGRWVLEAGPDGAACRRAAPTDGTDLRLDITALGSLYMGAFPASLLASAGRVQELRPGRLAVADRLLGTWPAPTTTTNF